MKKIHEALTEILPRIIELSEDIYCHPELGFKEFRSREKVTEALSQAGIPYKDVAYRTYGHVGFWKTRPRDRAHRGV